MMTMMKRVRFTAAIGLAAAACLVLNGCGESAPTDNGGDAPSTESARASIPAGLFLDAAPENAQSLGALKQSATIGEEVVFTARIGGRVEPFTEGAAVFLVADTDIPTCDELHGDGCPTPWDYCCEPKDNLLANLATVQILDADGRPLKTTAKGVNGLNPQATVTIIGTVSQSDGAVFVVDASGIHVSQG
jgi:hypothetical protein